MGKLVMIPDMVVVILAAVAFGTVNAALYGLIQMYLLSKVMDMILYGWDTSRWPTSSPTSGRRRSRDCWI